MISINGNTLNNTELLQATWTGRYKDSKKEYIILARYSGEPKYVVSTAYEHEEGWIQGHYFHPKYEDLALKQARDKFDEMVKKYRLPY